MRYCGGWRIITGSTGSVNREGQGGPISLWLGGLELGIASCQWAVVVHIQLGRDHGVSMEVAKVAA